MVIVYEIGPPGAVPEALICTMFFENF